MGTSWTNRTVCFKSRLPVVAAFLFRSRETQVARRRALRSECNDLRQELKQLNRKVARLEKENRELRRRMRVLSAERTEVVPTAVTLRDPPLGSHGYGARMITLAVNLARKVGLRGAANSIKIVFEWLGISAKTPVWTTIRSWIQRLGVARCNEPLERSDDWIWMVDHSNQIGIEKTLAVLGVRASSLPEAGNALKHEDVHVLSVQPGTQWQAKDMAEAYQQLADRHGVPRAVVMDGATELRSGTKCLKNRRSDMIVLRDFKHYAANVFKSLVGEDAQFKGFGKQLGLTRSAVQQTELAHLTPPKPKQKSRFMNLAATLRWGEMILWLYDHPQAQGRAGISDERFEVKLGWIRDYRADLAEWQECQRVLSVALSFVNNHGLYRGASISLRAELGDFHHHEKTKQLARRLVTFVKESEEQLEAGERLPLSTEILESSFSRYKRFERDHAKDGFTSLLASFAALLKPTTCHEIETALTNVSCKDVKAWVDTNLGTTLASRRKTTYREYAKATKKCATTLLATTSSF